MRAPFALSVLVLAAGAQADRLITIPTAKKLTDGSLRLETVQSLQDHGSQFNYAAFGLGQYFEGEIRTEKYSGHDFHATADFTYNFVSPLAGLTPGLAFGLQDIAGTTRTGRRAFACATFREESDTGLYSDLTLGAFLGSHSGLMVGFDFPLTNAFHLIADYNADRAQAGFEARPFRNFAARFIVRDNEPMASLTYRMKF